MKRIKQLITSGIPFTFDGRKVITGENGSSVQQDALHEWLYEWSRLGAERDNLAKLFDNGEACFQKAVKIIPKAEAKLKKMAEKFDFEVVSSRIEPDSNSKQVRIFYALSSSLLTEASLNLVCASIDKDEFRFEPEFPNAVLVIDCEK